MHINDGCKLFAGCFSQHTASVLDGVGSSIGATGSEHIMVVFALHLRDYA